MGQRYQGPNQALMLALIEQSREFIDRDITLNYPNHLNWVHLNHQGLHYHFYARNNFQLINNQLPQRVILDLAVRQVRDEIFLLQHDGQDELREFRMPDGSLAARVQIFDLNIDLEEMPPIVRIYKHWLHFGFEQPQFANVLSILE